MNLSDGSIQVWSSVPRLKMIQCWDPKSFKLIREISTPKAVHSMIQCEFNIWMGMEDGELAVVSCNEGVILTSWPTGYNNTVGALNVYQNCVWSGDDSGNIQVWYQDKSDDETNFWYINYASPHFSTINNILTVYQYIWTISNDHSIIIWNVEVCCLC